MQLCGTAEEETDESAETERYNEKRSLWKEEGRRREREKDKIERGDGGRGKTGAEKTWSNLQQS